MRHAILFGVLLASLGAGPMSAGDLPRAYFAATEPGSWARYETSIPGGGKNAATYTRLADEGGAFVVEIVTEFLEGAGAGGSSTGIFVLEPDFDWKRRLPQLRQGTERGDLHDGGASTDAAAGEDGGGDAGLHGRLRRRLQRDGNGDPGGIECDVYTFHAVLGGPNPGKMNGEVCLSAVVPFGMVHETATSHNEKSGESAFETRLVDSGSGPSRAAPVQAAAPPLGPTAQRMDIALAYQRGAIALDFRVPANTGGRVLKVALTNLGAEPLVIGVGTSTYALEVGPPIGTLFFQPVYEDDVELPPGATSSEFHAGQSGGRGVREGSFRLVMRRGVPTLTGDVKVGKNH